MTTQPADDLEAFRRDVRAGAERLKRERQSTYDSFDALEREREREWERTPPPQQTRQLTKAAPPRARSNAPEIGFLNPDAIATAFRALIYSGIALLAFLSVIGTFYGIAGVQAPLADPGQMVTDIAANVRRFGIALGVQTILTLTQYGSRQMARHNRRWWAVYLVALGISLWYNIQAYYAPLLLMGVPWALDYILIAAGDVVPEVGSVRRRS